MADWGSCVLENQDRLIQCIRYHSVINDHSWPVETIVLRLKPLDRMLEHSPFASEGSGMSCYGEWTTNTKFPPETVLGWHLFLDNIVCEALMPFVVFRPLIIWVVRFCSDLSQREGALGELDSYAGRDDGEIHWDRTAGMSTKDETRRCEYCPPEHYDTVGSHEGWFKISWVGLLFGHLLTKYCFYQLLDLFCLISWLGKISDCPHLLHNCAAIVHCKQFWTQYGSLFIRRLAGDLYGVVQWYLKTNGECMLASFEMETTLLTFVLHVYSNLEILDGGICVWQ